MPIILLASGRFEPRIILLLLLHWSVAAHTPNRVKLRWRIWACYFWMNCLNLIERYWKFLRQPLEAKEIVISRASRQITFPANFQLVAAMNPCPCGYAFNQDIRCQCSPDSIKRYQNRISGPLLDRIDLHIDVPPLQAYELQDNRPTEDSETVRQRVIAAYEIQMQRQNSLNMSLSPKQLEHYAGLDQTAQNMLELAQQKLNLSARGYHRVLRVARTIADLNQSTEIQSQHLSEALSYRGQQQI